MKINIPRCQDRTKNSPISLVLRFYIIEKSRLVREGEYVSGLLTLIQMALGVFAHVWFGA